MTELFTPRWYPLRYHAGQSEYSRSIVRFNVAHAGRRSGKSEVAKRRVVKRAFEFTDYDDGYFIFGAPTRDQAKRIFWSDLKKFVPPSMRLKKPSEVELAITLVTGTVIQCVGLDVPERIEGRPIDGGVCDEYGNMKKEVWGEHLRPALDTVDRPGWMDFIGVPEGRNHYWELVMDAGADPNGEWAVFHWDSADILTPAAIEAARRDLDPKVFDQEYRGSFVSFLGRAYYAFDSKKHCVKGLPYDPKKPLILCFDFNVTPGVVIACQEIDNADGRFPASGAFTGVVGEIYIHRDSNTPTICKAIIKKWGDHPGEIFIYGDATGGARKTSSDRGSDWDIIRQDLKPTFSGRMRWRVPKANPSERARVSSMNTRFMSGAEEIRMLVDPVAAPNLVRDLEGVRTMDDGSGEIDKKADKMLTHPSDALGYYIVEKFPIGGGHTTRVIAI